MSKPESESFARIFTEALVQLGISQREAASRSGISEMMISNMALGHIPSVATLVRFCRKLTIEPHQLLLSAGYSEEEVTTAGDSSLCRPFLLQYPMISWGEINSHQLEADGYCQVTPQQASVTDFCLRISDDTMWPTLCYGDMVGLQAWSRPENDWLMLVSDGQQSLLRTVRRIKGGWALAALNSNYPAIKVNFSPQGWIAIARVSWSLRNWLK